MQGRKDTPLEITPIRIQMEENQRHYELFQIAVRFLYLGMASFGFVYWLFSMLDLEVMLQAVFLVAGIATSWFFLVFGSKIRLLITLSLSFLMIDVYVVLLWRSIVNGWKILCNRIFELLREYYGLEIQAYTVSEGNYDLDILCCLFTFIMVMVLAFGILRLQNMATIYVLSVILLCASLSVERFPDMLAFVLWAGSCLGIHATGSREKGKTLSYLQGQAGMVMLICSCVLLALTSLWIVPRIHPVFEDNHEKAVAIQEKVLEDFMVDQAQEDEEEQQPAQAGPSGEGEEVDEQPESHIGPENDVNSPDQQMGKQDSDTEQGTKPNGEVTPSANPQPTQVQEDEGSIASSDERMWTPKEKTKSILFKILAWILGIAVLCGLMWLRRYLILRRRCTRFSSTVKKRAIVAISHETYRMLRSTGYIHNRKMSDQEYGMRIQRAFPILDNGGFLKFVEVVQRAEFSQNLPTSKDVQFCQYIYRKLEHHLGKKGSKVRQFWWKYIRCYEFID